MLTPLIPALWEAEASGSPEIMGVVGEVTHAMSFAINGSLVLVCIALGVAIPNIFAKKWIAPHRKAKLKWDI